MMNKSRARKYSIYADEYDRMQEEDFSQSCSALSQITVETIHSTLHGKRQRKKISDIHCDSIEPWIAQKQESSPASDLTTLRQLNCMFVSERDIQMEMEKIEQILGERKC